MFTFTPVTGRSAAFSSSSGRPSASSFATSSNQQASLFSHTGPFQTNNVPPRFGKTDPFSGIRTSQSRGTRIKSYATTRIDGEPGMKCSSISAMATYCDKSHEELKWEDYQLKIQGTSAFIPFSMLPNTSSTLLTSNQPSKSSPSYSCIFPKISNTSGFGSSFSQSNATATSSLFPNATTLSSISSSFSGCAYSNRTSSSPLSLGVTSNAGTNSSPFTNKAASQLVFSSLSSSATTNSSLMPGFSSCSTSPFTMGAFTNQLTVNNTPAQSFPSPFQPSPGIFSSTGSVSRNTFSITPSPRTPSMTANPHPSHNYAANSTSGSSVLLNIDPSFSHWQAHSGQTVATSSAEAYIQVPANGQGLFNTASNQFPARNYFPSISAPLFSTTEASTVDIVSVKDPFGVHKGGSHSLSGHATSVPSYSIGISNMALTERSTSKGPSLLLIPRHVSSRQITLRAKVSQIKDDNRRVPFFIGRDNHELPIPTDHTVPRENIRSVISNSLPVTCKAVNGGKASQLNLGIEESSLGDKAGELSIPNLSKGTSTSGAGRSSNDEYLVGFSAKVSPNPDSKKRTSIEEITPKLRRSDYYTEPAISMLAVKEELEPGFMGHVKGFAIGRCRYGHVEFEGETDVRGLDLDTIIDFNFREFIVYMDGKPPVGEGLNKPALVTLLNVKCIDKKTGEECVKGKKVEIFKKMLKRAAEHRGAEFVSYDPVAGEWKFRVEHF